MNKINKIAKGSILLNEAPKSLAYKQFGKEAWEFDNSEKIQYAISNCRRTRITYDDKKGGKGKNTRYIFPLVYGVTKNGKKAIRAFQTGGSTKRGAPKYKLFLFDNIGYVDVGRVKYTQYEDLLLNTGFNPYGDKSFAEIYAITPLARNFNSANLTNINEPIDSEPTTKTDVLKPEPTQASQSQHQQPSQPVQGKKSNVSIDNPTGTTYPSKTDAPAPEPVTKNQIEPQQNGDENGENDAERVYAPETVPVTKADVGHQEINRDNKLTRSFDDMMRRMNNLYNDENEEENED